jgi:hypothetical protein
MMAIRSPLSLFSVPNGIEYLLIVYLAFLHVFGDLGKGTSVAFFPSLPPSLLPVIKGRGCRL